MTTHEAIVNELSTDELAARLRAVQVEAQGAHEGGGGGDGIGAQPATPHPNATAVARPYRHFRPLVEAAEDYIAWAERPDLRIYTGLDEFDAAMRGIAPSELMLVQGYSHSGKTVFVTQMLLNNRDKRVVWFTPDETRVAVLVKLASIIHGLSAEEFERRIAADDDTARTLLRQTALRDLPTLAVYEDSVDVDLMTRMTDEAQTYWGAPPQLVVFDYSKLLGGIDDVVAKVTALKRWAKNRQVPFVLVHQAKRTGSSGGQELGMDSGEYGGEQQATFLVNVRRKREFYRSLIRDLTEKMAIQVNPSPSLGDQIAEAEYEMEAHQDTISFSLVKNKRPPCHQVDEMDWHLDPVTGRIQPMASAPPRSFRRASEARAAATRTSWSQPSMVPDEDF